MHRGAPVIAPEDRRALHPLSRRVELPPRLPAGAAQARAVGDLPVRRPPRGARPGQDAVGERSQAVDRLPPELHQLVDADTGDGRVRDVRLDRLPCREIEAGFFDLRQPGGVEGGIHRVLDAVQDRGGGEAEAALHQHADPETPAARAVDALQPVGFEVDRVARALGEEDLRLASTPGGRPVQSLFQEQLVSHHRCAPPGLSSGARRRRLAAAPGRLCRSLRRTLRSGPCLRSPRCSSGL